MDHEIIFSVLVPVFNAQKYLDMCIQSVLAQTYANFELILVNDGSVDDSGAICDRYAQSDARISAYHKENRGQLHTREFAISKAIGDYCVFLDADDTLERNALEVLVSKINKYDSDCIIFRLSRVWEGEKLTTEAPMQDVCIEDKREVYRKCLMASEYNSMCIKAVKRSVFSGFVDYSDCYAIRLAEDLLQSLEVFKNSNRIAFIGDLLYNYTANPNSVTQGMRCDRYRPDFIVYERVLEFLYEENVFTQQDYREYHSWCVELCIHEIKRVCGYKDSWSNKVRALDRIRNEAFYKEYLLKEKTDWKAVGIKSLIFWLYKYRFDGFLAFVLPIWWKRPTWLLRAKV